ncbi:MAG: ribosomal RNA small subunit methyltransferase A [Candidatus Yanofskybacteria bacterium RIFCSPHIGHO2_12_FULL_45_19b]|uniref:Ribosomal RNA small subunit methyltransferase A n=1 Tax=Candidatus Yanofskybacteria bacterium RIFCSPHIGHO2_12_FULL_45_19b TaxID=1802689 RepID=A0A1F8G2S6_9BACT|nr:MAG: ribosomal RNA small subunit methyltransferase A [Candidatus Yanofskybacteria bacterium RIFCSPHIGHO2_12_FULL_45_19b]
MIKAKKSLGQNWLIDPEAHEKIIATLAPQVGETILEVGPGTGLLTRHLVNSGANIVAIEKDEVLASQLAKKFPTVKIITGDILKLDIETLIGNWKMENGKSCYKVVGNIPYYLTSHLIRLALEEWPQPQRIVFLVQQEVAERAVAKPPHANLLSLSIEYYATASIVGLVNRSSFDPMPEVDSAILKIQPDNRQLTIDYRRKFFRLLHIGFASKRKQLVNNLSVGLKIDKDEIVKIIKNAGLDPQIRPENLSFEQWNKLVHKVVS